MNSNNAFPSDCLYSSHIESLQIGFPFVLPHHMMGSSFFSIGREELFNHPVHPYTQSLLSAVPIPDPILERKKVLKVYDPEQHDYSVDKPEMAEIRPGHYVWANKAELEKYKQEQE